ncbi:MAG: hypoxanthine phosphoribosyltransferase, partial [Nitrospirota bacterium]
TEVISPLKITEAVRRLGAEINRDYAGREILAVCVLNGSFIFFSDLIRELTVPIEVDFLKVKSYCTGMESSGELKVDCWLKADVTGRDVLVVEDIVDTGLTLSVIIQRLRAGNPKTLKVCALLDKRARRKAAVNPDYAGFLVEDQFLVGYGLDLDGRYRNLRGVCKVRPPGQELP